MGRTACTEPQCLYKGEFYFLFIIIIIIIIIITFYNLYADCNKHQHVSHQYIKQYGDNLRTVKHTKASQGHVKRTFPTGVILIDTSRRRVTSLDKVPSDIEALEGAYNFTVSEYVAMFPGWMTFFLTDGSILSSLGVPSLILIGWLPSPSLGH